MDSTPSFTVSKGWQRQSTTMQQYARVYELATYVFTLRHCGPNITPNNSCIKSGFGPIFNVKTFPADKFHFHHIPFLLLFCHVIQEFIFQKIIQVLIASECHKFKRLNHYSKTIKNGYVRIWTHCGIISRQGWAFCDFRQTRDNF